MSGWIKLHRKLLDWEWYDDINTKTLYLHLLLTANHADKRWRGVDVPQGSTITGRKRLAQETGLSEQQVRTCLEKLQSTNEITINSSSLFSLISITNWQEYQDSNQQNNQGATKEQPTSNQRVTTTKEYKNVKNNINTPLAMLVDMGVEKRLANEWLQVRNKKKLASTQTAFDGVLREANKAGLSMNQAVKKAVEESWAGFKASWIDGATETKTDYRGPVV